MSLTQFPRLSIFRRLCTSSHTAKITAINKIEADREAAVPTSSLAIIAADGMGTIYRPLEDSLQFTRLLTLSRTSDGKIICFLDHVQLANLPEYTALSYCWGSCDDTRSVFVNAIERQVTRNLYDALERLHHKQISRLWVDALCINQEDNQEKGHQVQLMKLIYSRAKSVIAWIGKSSADSSQAMAALKRMPAESSRARDTIWEKLEIFLLALIGNESGLSRNLLLQPKSKSLVVATG
jgi:hypothetical protein